MKKVKSNSKKDKTSNDVIYAMVFFDNAEIVKMPIMTQVNCPQPTVGSTVKCIYDGDNISYVDSVIKIIHDRDEEVSQYESR